MIIDQIWKMVIAFDKRETKGDCFEKKWDNEPKIVRQLMTKWQILQMTSICKHLIWTKAVLPHRLTGLQMAYQFH